MSTGKHILFMDFETSGLPLFSEPSSDPRQPHIVQAAAILVDAETRKEIASIDLIARPTDWEIPVEVSDIHGITTEHARKVGVPEDMICAMIMHLWCHMDDTEPRLRVAHNESFDARIQRIALKRFMGDASADAWKSGQSECTANLSAPIVNLPPTAAMKATGRAQQPKRPKLTEAYEFFFGKTFDGAHTAMADVRACMAVYWAIKDRDASSVEAEH